MIKFVKIEQSTKEWLDLRRGKVTATMYRDYLAVVDKVIPNIFNISKNKLFMPIVANKFMLAGSKHEDEIRVNYNIKHGTDYEDICALYGDNLMSSLDGLDFYTNSIIEIKCTTKKLDYFYLTDTIAFYKAQCLHQLYCSGADRCILHFASRLDLKKTLDITIEKEGNINKWLSKCNEIRASEYFKRSLNI